MGGGHGERALEAEGLATHGVELAGPAVRAVGLVAPARGERGAVELEVEAVVVCDRQRRTLVEIGDEVGGGRGLSRVDAELGEAGRLPVHPPARRHEQELDPLVVQNAGLQGKRCAQIGERQGGAVARMSLELEAARARDLEAKLDPSRRHGFLDRGTAGSQVGGEGTGRLLGRGVGHEQGPQGVILGRGSELPDAARGNDAQQLGAEGAALVALLAELDVGDDRHAIRLSRLLHLGVSSRSGARRCGERSTRSPSDLPSREMWSGTAETR